MTDFPITIFHNPACGTSRNTLAMIRAAGYQPEVVEYMETGWTRPQLEELFAALGATPRDAMREKGTPAAELGLTDTQVRRHGAAPDPGEPTDRDHAEGR